MLRDPTDLIWLRCAERIGLRVVRGDEGYATTDGRGQLTIGCDSELDDDDCLAQMIFHELCHSLVEGEGSFDLPDWGLDNTSSRDEVREHACVRAQAFLAARYGLRRIFAPTTDYRQYFDALGDDVLAPRHDEAVQLAIAAIKRASAPPWAPHLEIALKATRDVALAMAQARGDGPRSNLWDELDPVPSRHPSGLPGTTATDRRCADCAWSYRGGPGRAVPRCRQVGGARIDLASAACERFELALDCQQCGACCREAYGSVTISKRDPFIRRHPELVVHREGYVEIARDGERCAALTGGPSSAQDFIPFACRVYEDRPAPCRDHQNAGEHCLTARRRVHLSL